MSQKWSSTWASLGLRSDKEQTLVFDWLYLPGWRADIDGQAVEVFPSAPAGLVALDAPAGQFDLRIALGSTTTQAAAQVLSALGLVGLAALLMAWRHLPGASEVEDQSLGMDLRLVAGFAALGIGMFLFKTLSLDAIQSPFSSSRFGASVDSPALANFDNRIDLLAADLPSGVIDQRSFEIALVWRLHDRALERDYSSIVRMRDPWGAVIAEVDSFAPGGLQTSNWLENAYVEDVITLDVSPFTPPLEAGYNLEVALFDVHTLEALSVINLSGNPQDVKHPFASIRYRPVQGDQCKTNDLQRIRRRHGTGCSWSKRRNYRLRPPSAMSCNLTGRGRKSTMARPAFQLDFFGWQRVGRRHMFRGPCPWLTDMTSRNGASARSFAVIIACWSRRICRPGNMPWACNCSTPLETRPPQPSCLTRRWKLRFRRGNSTRPYSTAPSTSVWDNGLVLHGNRSGESGELHLVWGTRRPLPESLRLFVHLLDEQDLIAAQWDGVPVDWSRPTTSWLPDEYVTTSHRFDLPAGQYRIRLGWYDPVSGERVSVGDGDAFQLEQRLHIK